MFPTARIALGGTAETQSEVLKCKHDVSTERPSAEEVCNGLRARRPARSQHKQGTPATQNTATGMGGSSSAARTSREGDLTASVKGEVKSFSAAALLSSVDGEPIAFYVEPIGSALFSIVLVMSHDYFLSHQCIWRLG